MNTGRAIDLHHAYHMRPAHLRPNIACHAMPPAQCRNVCGRACACLLRGAGLLQMASFSLTRTDGRHRPPPLLVDMQLDLGRVLLLTRIPELQNHVASGAFICDSIHFQPMRQCGV